MPSWDVHVEVLVLRLLDDGRLGHRWVRGRVGSEDSPDELAVELASCTAGLCHSTSWRREATGRLVLTYAALPDHCLDEPATPLPVPLVLTGGEALRPSPAEVDRAHVAAHAVRHLDDLAVRDPVVVELVRQDAPIWLAVAEAAASARHAMCGRAS